MAETARSGYLPMAVSADNITASVPSSTAFATSKTSARVGIWFSIMDSIICVAVITTRFRRRARLMMSFCTCGRAASPISTPRSPRATIMASEARMMSSITSSASVRSILATIPPFPPAASTSPRASSTSAAERGKEMAT